MKIREIIVRRAEKGEKIMTLDDETYELNEDILVIADSQKPLAIAGIKGGKGAEVTKSTERIIVSRLILIMFQFTKLHGH